MHAIGSIDHDEICLMIGRLPERFSIQLYFLSCISDSYLLVQGIALGLKPLGGFLGGYLLGGSGLSQFWSHCFTIPMVHEGYIK